MSYLGLSRDRPPFEADALVSLRLIGLGFPDEARRILAGHTTEPAAVETVALLDEHAVGRAILRLDSVVDPYALA